jgi:cob(I)alamin adenosyltransferase
MAGPFYTRAGDEGFTGLLGKGRVPKEDLRIEALGVIDEANAALGIARSHARSAKTPGLIVQVQRDLYGIMAELASTAENSARFRTIDTQKVTWLEVQIDALSAITPYPREFIVPGDTVVGAYMDLARTIVRRAERRLSELLHHGDIENHDLLHYLNRLSSLCYVLELHENYVSGNTEITLAKSGDDQ